MVGIEFSRFQHGVQKDTPKRVTKGPEMESKWTQDMEKEDLEANLVAMKALA